MEKYDRNRLELIDAMIEEPGYIFCQTCNTTSSFKFHCHHIMFRSEKPNHPMLHHKRNLIIVCDSCHNNYHGDKEAQRGVLVIERGLIQLFEDGKN